MKKFVKPVAKPEQVPSMKAPLPPQKAMPPARVPAPAPAPMQPMPAMPSPMARPPAAKTSRQVPSVPTARGVVRTDTHNQANQVPASAKHKGRGV